MEFEPQESSNRHLNVVVLRLGALALRPFGSTVLLESAVVGFHAPGPASKLLALLLGHLQVIGCPILDLFCSSVFIFFCSSVFIFRVSVCGDGPKDLHEAEALQVHLAPFFGNVDLLDLPAVSIVRIDLPVFL